MPPVLTSDRPETLPGPLPERTIEVETDLDSEGRLGRSRLLVENGEARRYQETPTGEELVASYRVADLENPRLDDLVDATALVADRDGRAVELLRASNRRNAVLSGAERQLRALVEGKPVPELDADDRLCPKCGRPLPKNSDVCESCVDRGATLKRLFGYTKPHKSRMVLGVVLSFAGSAIELVPPLITMKIVNDLVAVQRSGAPATAADVRGFLLLIGAFLAALVAKAVFQALRGRNVAYLGMVISRDIRNSLFEKLQSLSLGFYDKRNVGSLMSRMTNDTGALYDVLVDGIPVVLNQILLLILIPAALLVLNWKIGLLAIAPLPFVLFAVNRFRRRMNRVWSRYHHQNARLSGALNGILQGTRVVKAFHGEDREVTRFNRRVSELTGSGYTAENSWATFFPFVLLTMGLGLVVTWLVGGLAALRSELTVGALVAFVAYVQRLNEPLMMLQRLIDWSTRALTAAERVFEILDTPVEVAQAPDAVRMPNVAGHVVFEGVHFGYDKTREVIHGIDLEVKPGEMVGIVGHSGSGKTTLINLILRFYDPTQGRIAVDGVDMKRVDGEDFRRQFGVVLQESYLFPGSIRDNIAYGRPDAGLDEIVAAAKAANAHNFIVGFPDGYDTYVGERGQRLSGGERQRISIARAILHNPKVLILDEATASVDTETERMIQDAIDNLVEGRTVFAIAHRLSTLRQANRLVVMDDGKIAELGTHEELLKIEGGIYRKLVEMQAEVSALQKNVIGAEPEGEESQEPETAGAR